MNCQRCNQVCSEDDCYCKGCGLKIGDSSSSFLMSPLSLASTIVVTSLVVFGILHFESLLIGKSPTNQHVFSESNADSYETESIKSAKILVEKEPDNIAHRQGLAQVMWARLADFSTPPQALVLDLIDVLSTILSSSPNDKDALLMLANLSFNQKVFNKSVEYFQRYLTLDPTNKEARSSYASALTFLGEFDSAIKELDLVLAGNPKFFQAIAYKAIAYAQMGKIAEAKRLGQEALSVAPSDEARARFNGFIDSLDQSSAKNSSSQTAERPIVSFIRSSATASSKFSNSTFSDGVLVLAFKDFPMDKMPAQVRDSFLQKLKDEAKKDKDITAVKIIDLESNREMVSFSLSSK